MDNFFKNKKIGFACKWINPKPPTDKKEAQKIIEVMNFKGTTRKFINSLKTKKEQFEKVEGIINHNLTALQSVLMWLCEQPINLRMMRIGSDMLPFYTLAEYKWIYDDKELMKHIQNSLALSGEISRVNGIRLSMHPGQFCILNSGKPSVVDNSVEEFEYHCDIMRWMGFTGWHPYGMEINVHGGSKIEGLDPLITVIKTRLSEDARNWISIENDEYSYGIEDLHRLSEICAILPDVHHHFINSKGEYIQPGDKRLLPYINSWRGIIPEMHFSVSPEYVLSENISTLPDFGKLILEGYSRTDLRKHSNGVPNSATNNWVLGFWQDFDIMVEAKDKNLASFDLYRFAENTNINLNR